MKNSTAVIIPGIICILALIITGCASNTPKGAKLFVSERCIYCHTFKGQGAKIGPELTDVTKRRSDDWIRDQIRNPKLHNPQPGMPGHEYLSAKEINAIIKFLKS
ncbi:MAG TPA: c-type cytochrome [Thermodesulfovibrionales bacterium]|nr:c-type cytochrome [Thermodesulfovibrionales bacterium]